MGLGFQSFSLDSPRGEGGSIRSVRLFRFSFIPSSRGDVHAVDQEMEIQSAMTNMISALWSKTTPLIGKLKLGVLKNLCENLRIPMPHDPRRKAPYISRLEELAKSCSCSTATIMLKTCRWLLYSPTKTTCLSLRCYTPGFGIRGGGGGGGFESHNDVSFN